MCFKYLNVLLILILIPFYTNCSYQGEEITKWVNAIGRDLWDLGKSITKYSEIEQRYKINNAQVDSTDPTELLDEIVANLSRMIDRKMDAVQCIIDKAEEESLAFEYNSSKVHEYYNSKYSSAPGVTQNYGFKIINDSFTRYLPMELNEDTHFYNLPVDTNHSSVHVPTNVFDLHDDASVAIQWSTALDEVFVKNYNSDPSLSWQYFGSFTGIMRHYPAKSWPDNVKDTFDCRIRTWFIEAATCTKDIVILIDNSGSMEGMGKHIGVLTASAILDTLSNNDYVNVLNYTAKMINYTVDCFENSLVQATEENIAFFKLMMKDLEPQNKTDLAEGLTAAFEILAHYREKVRFCDGIRTHCNQAIMVITDTLQVNLSAIVMKYDFLNNGTYKPVRIFSYLVGQAVSNSAEIKWLSCATKGFYVHVQAVEQVTSAVLEYVNVIARPLILQNKFHPISWTHAYMDDTYQVTENDRMYDKPYRLLTSAAGPAFDKKYNKINKKGEREARLLGVAGTDVPIDAIRELILPYKIGVNGYAFIVTNNGYVLMHPDLKPMVKGKKMINYNSIDLSEVEQMEGDDIPRVLHSNVDALRSHLINGSRGSLLNISIKYHYDLKRRVSVQKFDYYFAPLTETPFTIALALPSVYGHHSLKVGDEINKNRHTGKKITDFFAGKNWRVHPKWVYCRYFYIEGHEFDDPESEIYHFLGKMYDGHFQWRGQYESSHGQGEEDLTKVECGRKSLKDNDYFCDRQLVQRLIFDAKNTQASFDKHWDFKKAEIPLFEKYNVSLRFMATMSGLTRWEYYDEKAMENQKKFGDIHSKAIDEMWYQAAVLQQQYNSESFVYAVPENSDSVMGSFAIFPKDAGNEAPGSVVGFEFSQEKLREKVIEVSTKLSNICPECAVCNADLSCYILDSSAYVIVSTGDTRTGHFFGEVEPDIMTSMVEDKIYKKVPVYDYQGLCEVADVGETSSANQVLTSQNMMTAVASFIATEFLNIIFQFGVNQFYFPVYAMADNVTNAMPDNATNAMTDNATNAMTDNATNAMADNATNAMADNDTNAMADNATNATINNTNQEDEMEYIACDQRMNLYVLQQDYLKSNNFSGEYFEISEGDKVTRRGYYVKPIPNSNLVFIAISTKGKDAMVKLRMTTKPVAILYEKKFPCYKIYLYNLSRGKLNGCFFKNELEDEIKACGRSSSFKIYFVILVISAILHFLA